MLRLPKIHVAPLDGQFERAPERGQLVLSLTSCLEEVVTSRTAAGRFADLVALPSLRVRRREPSQEFRIVKRDRIINRKAVEVRF